MEVKDWIEIIMSVMGAILIIVKRNEFWQWIKGRKKGNISEDIIKIVTSLDATSKGLMTLIVDLDKTIRGQCFECDYKKAFPVLQRGIIKEISDELVLKVKDGILNLLFKYNFVMSFEVEKEINNIVDSQRDESNRALFQYKIDAELIKKYNEALNTFNDSVLEKVILVLKENGESTIENKKRRLRDFIISQTDVIKNNIFN